MPGLGETLTHKAGPLPVWAWAGLGTAALAGFLYYRQKQSAASTASTSNSLNSNLGTVPVSNLTVSGEPMPLQMGDTFVDVTAPDVGADGSTTGATPTQPPNAKAPNVAPAAAPAPLIHLPMQKVNISAKKPVTAILHPAPKPAAPTATNQRTVTVCAYPSWCGSLSGIAQHFYGNANDWTKIYNANKGKIGANPNVIHEGQVLVIPA